VPPVFHSRLRYGPHCSSCQDIASRNLAIPVAKFSDLFLRGPEIRSLAQIQRSSCVPDPTTVLISPTSRPRDLEYPMLDSQLASSRVREIPRSLTTCPPQMDGYDPLAPSSPRVLAPRDFEHPILGLSPCELPSSRDH
jgi:hypothetical protein